MQVFASLACFKNTRNIDGCHSVYEQSVWLLVYTARWLQKQHTV